MRAITASSVLATNSVTGGMRHFARADKATVIQLHGVGPWGLTYVNPADRPNSASR
jgi:hypothetical protein